MLSAHYSFLFLLLCSYFETQEHYDIVSVHVGVGRTDTPVNAKVQPLVAKWHGNRFNTVRVPGNTATIIFVTDSAITSRGFRASITYLSSGACADNQASCGQDTDRGTCIDAACVCTDGWHGFDCSSPVCERQSVKQMISDSDHLVLSTNHPVKHPTYPNDLACQWQFLSPPSAESGGDSIGILGVRFNVRSFEIEKNFDTLVVSLMDGSTTLYQWNVVNSDASECHDSGLAGSGVETCVVTKDVVNAKGVSVSSVYFNKACNAPCKVSYVPNR